MYTCPKFSIITINLNNRLGLKKTIDSVINQNYSNYEYIIIDGASIDGSLEEIKKYSDAITFWKSEPDQGIYHAMNKGINIARGEYVLFLNSGDFFVDNYVLLKAQKQIEPDDQICTGDTLLQEKTGLRLHRSPEVITFEHMRFDTIAHPSSFIRRELFQNYGMYNENFKIVSDWAFFFKVLIMHNVRYKKLHFNVSVFDMYGISGNPAFRGLLEAERATALNNVLPPKIREYIQDQNKMYNIIHSKRFSMMKIIEKHFFFRAVLHVFMIVLSFFLKAYVKIKFKKDTD